MTTLTIFGQEDTSAERLKKVILGITSLLLNPDAGIVLSGRFQK
jgi:hypothetical protein